MNSTNRPLLVSDCDEVLLHMIGHFATWVEEAHQLNLRFGPDGFREALRDRDGEPVAEERIWPLLDGFFENEMHRQNLVPGAVEALAAIGEVADIVILTNVGDEHQARRVAQLERFDIRHRVICNRGGKGRPVLGLIEQMQPSVTLFVDDLPVHHQSVANHAPAAWRLHMIAEPRIADHTPPAPAAHARIDAWDEALPWILARFAEGPAPVLPD